MRDTIPEIDIVNDFNDLEEPGKVEVSVDVVFFESFSLFNYVCPSDQATFRIIEDEPFRLGQLTGGVPSTLELCEHRSTFC